MSAFTTVTQADRAAAADWLEAEMRRYVYDTSPERRIAVLEKYRRKLGLPMWGDDTMTAPGLLPRALTEVACTLSMTASEVRIDCETREEAEEVFNWLEASVGSTDLAALVNSYKALVEFAQYVAETCDDEHYVRKANAALKL